MMKICMLPKIVLGAGALLMTTLPALAVDHNNIDANRPLNFDDAEAIAYRERSFETGVSLASPKSGGVDLVGEAEFLYGFRKNAHVILGIDPSLAREGENDKRRASIGDLAFGALYNFNRETEGSPAFGVRADAFFPTGRGSSGVDFRVRGMASRTFRQYARLHLNLDLNVNNSPGNGERRTQPGIILGYSKPLGYPTRFNRTMVAEIGYRAAPSSGNSGILNVGVGLRQQVTVRSVFDVGVLSDLAGGGDDRQRVRLVAGYSTSF
jgi:Putative MetA-pathway of phenol degradation